MFKKQKCPRCKIELNYNGSYANCKCGYNIYDVNAIETHLKVHEDKRGILTEIIKDKSFGQIYVIKVKPKKKRGNHYHKRKTEWFTAISGKGKAELRDIKTNKKETYILSGKTPTIIKVKPKINHTIKNTQNSQLILLVYVDEIFNKEKPDTYKQGVA